MEIPTLFGLTPKLIRQIIPTCAGQDVKAILQAAIKNHENMGLILREGMLF